MDSNAVHLLPHNEEAFIKLKKCLEDNQLVAINHATGTGKSFIILKYLYENRNKKILFLSPSYPINDQLMQEHTTELGIDVNEFNKIDTLIYSNLLEMDMQELAKNYDIVVLDEYHRCGAKKWGIKVNELLSYIKNYPQKKVIGTTATEIRYLDQEKNMNNILFDGVCASTLTLADAMLKEILPVPIYINSPFELNSEYEKILKKVYQLTTYDVERDYYLQLVAGVRGQIDEIISNEENISEYVKKDGKHLVFSSTIDKIDNDRITINKMLNNNHNEYIVHSKKSKTHNAKALKEFRYDSNPAILYCVNILNEGVHVKGVDSIFMLRPTTSPIIFFQQLGRLLSYSRRKDKVVVFDLINNIRKSPYIYQLYIDLCSKANELIQIDPDNKDKYLNILQNFKIVDTISKVSTKLDVLKNALLKDQFYKKRIDFIIEILQGNIKVNALEDKLAKLDLFKYYKYITLEQYRIIKKLTINKPSLFNLSEEEFINMLSGEENLYKKEKKLAYFVINRANEFYEATGSFPSILSKSMEERSLAIDLLNKYIDGKGNELLFKDKKIDNLTEYEKIFYGITKKVNFELLYREIDKLIENNISIHPTIHTLIQNQKTSDSQIYLDKILKNSTTQATSKMEEDNLFKESISKEEKQFLKITYTEDYTKVAKECMVEIQKCGSVNEYLKQLSEEIISFINETKSMPAYYANDVNFNEAKKMRTLYIKKMIFYNELLTLGYIELFDETYSSIQMQLARLNKEKVLENLIDFLKNHNGDMPSFNLDEDRKLAMDVGKINTLLNEEEINLINTFKSDTRTREVVIRYLTFVKKYRRYPLKTTTNEEEKKLLDDYIRNEKYFSDKDKKLINDLKKMISSKEAMKNAYIELLKQKKGR